MLEHGETALLSAIGDSLKERSSQALDLGGLQIICVPVITERNACGALLVGRVSPAHQDAGASRAQLELVASWLTAAVDAHLLSPPAFPSSGMNRVAPLAQLLGQASQRESDRELIRLFGEAIAVWHDIEVSGYVETTSGAFARDVTLPGTKKGERPAMIPLGWIARFDGSDSIAAGPSRSLWLASQQRCLRASLQGDGQTRVVAGVHGRDRCLRSAKARRLCRVARLGVVIVDDNVHRSNGDGDQRSASERGRDAGDQATRALEELRTSLGAAAASLTIESKSGVVMLRVRCPAGGSEDEVTTARSGSCSSNDRNGITLRPFRSGAMRACSSLLEITPRRVPRRRCSMSGLLLHLVGRLRVANAARRRVVSRRCSSVRRVKLSIEDRRWRWSSSLFAKPRRCQDQRSAGLAEIRAQMRASDLAGMLGEGEIGLLMHDTGAEQAKAIAERLRTVVGGEPGRESFSSVWPVGIRVRARPIVSFTTLAQMQSPEHGGWRVSDSPHGVNR